MPGELLLEIFSEHKGVRLGSQNHLSKTNKQAIMGFYFCTICNFELHSSGGGAAWMVMVCYKEIATETNPESLL